MICLTCGHYSDPDGEMQREQRSGACRCPCHPWNRPAPRVDGYPAGWPRCHCGRPALDGHLTCGALACDEGGARREL